MLAAISRDMRRIAKLTEQSQTLRPVNEYDTYPCQLLTYNSKFFLLGYPCQPLLVRPNVINSLRQVGMFSRSAT
jgi:hypothetical protein